MRLLTKRTTIGLRATTKDKLDRNRAPGQCYDGFICQMVDLWEQNFDNQLVSASKSSN